MVYLNPTEPKMTKKPEFSIKFYNFFKLKKNSFESTEKDVEATRDELEKFNEIINEIENSDEVTLKVSYEHIFDLISISI